MPRMRKTIDNHRFQMRATPDAGESARCASSPSMNGQSVNSCSLADSERYGYPLWLPFPWLLVGLGTTGTDAIHTVLHFVHEAIGKIPKGCRYLTVDAAPTQDMEHQLCHVAIGTDGAGTNPHNGRRLFLDHYDLVKHALQQQIDRLCGSVADTISPLKSAREVTGFLVVAGSGGTSGGTLDPMISLIHDCAQRRSIQEPRVQVVLIGPGMPLRDSSRQPLPEQVGLIHNTYAENLRRIYGLMQTPAHVRERRPDGTEFFVEASARVTGLQKVDYTNGLSDFATTSEFVGMLGHAIFSYVLTQAGEHARQRTRDNHGTGVTGLPTDQRRGLQ